MDRVILALFIFGLSWLKLENRVFLIVFDGNQFCLIKTHWVIEQLY